jgi:hypothetical protein
LTNISKASIPEPSAVPVPGQPKVMPALLWVETLEEVRIGLNEVFAVRPHYLKGLRVDVVR